MRKSLNILVLTFTLLVCWSCSKPSVPEPGAAALTIPENRNTCIPMFTDELIGIVNFSWETPANTDSYEVVVRNSVTRTEQKKAVDLTTITLVLDRGYSYTWWVISSSNISTVKTKSEVWSFYIEGIQQQTHLPFPAQLKIPLEGQTVESSSGQINLEWLGSDLDNDIAFYQIYLGTSPNRLQLFQDNLSIPNYSANLSLGETYYWKIVTVDRNGNKSESIIQTFNISS
tara:strand:+ start:8855 stop:9541 length:687 start_codon:yes stop_codon:yes gene_type:complete